MSSLLEEKDNDEETTCPSSDQNHQMKETLSIVVPSAEGINDEVKSLREKLSAALLDANAKDELVQQHAKVAEEAIAGWEKADNEAVELKQRLETAIQHNSTLENRITHLDGALKECVRQLRHSREEQEQTINEAVLKNTQDWKSIKYELESRILQLQAQLDASKDAPSVDSKIYHKLDYLKEENSALKFDLLSQSEELEIMTIERDLSTQAAESACKQHLESIKKVARLEAECRKLRAMANKWPSVNDYKSVAASSHYVESLTDSQSDSGEQQIAQDANTCEKSILEKSEHAINSSDSWASALIAELDQFKNGKAVNKNPTDEINLMDDFLEMERLAGLPVTVNENRLTSSEATADIASSEKASLRPNVEFTYRPTNELEGKAEEIGAEFVEFEDKIERNKVEYESEKTELETGELKCKSEIFAAERGEIEYNLERMKVEWHEMKLKLERVEAERDEMEYKLEKIEAARCEIECKLERIEAKRFEMEDQLEKTEAEKGEIRYKLERTEAQKAEREVNIERMEAEKAEIEDKMEWLEAQRAQMEDKVERMEAETAKHKEQIQRMKEVTDELVKRLQRAGEGKTSLEEKLVTTEAEKTELLEKLERMEAGKSDMEAVIKIAHDREQVLQAQLMEAEIKLQELQREMDMANGLKYSFEDKFSVAELDARTLSAKVDAIEGQLEKEQALSAELESKCQILEDELSRTQDLIHHQSAEGNRELKINQEDLAMAAGKLEECQQTIASLGNQLKSLATIENFLIDAAHAPQLSGGSIVPGVGGEIWKMHSNHTFLPKRAEGPQCTSPEARLPSFIGNDGILASPLLSSTLSLNHVNNEKGKNGFVRLFSRGKGSSPQLDI